MTSNLRRWITLTETAGLLREDEPTVKPKLLYHGTNLVAAAMIVNAGVIRATEPVDGEFAVVCSSSKRKVARDFAVEYVRANSELEVGAIFALDGQAILRDLEAKWCEAETASSNEWEYRIEGNVSLKKYCRGFGLVGKTYKLRSERWLEATYRSEDSRHFMRAHGYMSFGQFVSAVERLQRRA